MSDATKVLARCHELARITDVEGETTRTFLSPAMRRANDLVTTWMRDAGLNVRTDAAGNLRGVRLSTSEKAKTLILASHLDTVPNAGAFDGVLGVMMALAVVENLGQASLPFQIEVVAFSEEEGVRFGVPFIGSRAIVGTLEELLLGRKDLTGTSVREAIHAYGLDIEQLPDAVVPDALGYLEFHIEQGPALESEGLPLGVVETIAGQSRYELVFTGEANHAGTTPMPLRHDAMSAAAQWITEVETHARATRGLVATVGSVATVPGAGNVIAGEVRATLDVRSANDEIRDGAVTHLLHHANACGTARGVTVTSTLRMKQDAVPLDYGLLTMLEDAVDSTGAVIRRIVSGAGHDAMIVAPYMPAAMLFLRTPRGLSHHPDEAVLPADVQLGLDAGAAFVRLLAARENAR
ncbi:amidase, hydantoinase/carbamoylase family [Terriglobus roseus DSM 18391]|uniref:Amidase, hydantoinase/carbamoylase family n=1 Tax=Terriglobus roseus (strain DSM 18391 / NRRL B-41598 / KBS 63) TaxID=926566 RepID=I3ZD72_TERRK|nr:allantoate amidohydrolase [Terriglobus roseus]AFL87190.1 amidase, hydantoinase/carbamoylase family [Terriglobus roseus DSM 18391]